MSRVVCASDYGGPGDPTSGIHGYKGDNLNGRMAFAELNMGTALGNLPYKSKVKIDYNGRSVVAEKLDIGLGGAGCGGHGRGIDLWYQTAQALGFSGLAPVTITTEHESPTALPATQNASTGILKGLLGPAGEAEEKLFENTPGLSELQKGANALNPFSSLTTFFGDIEKIFEGAFWIKVGKVLLGLFLLLSGVLGMANVSAPSPVDVIERGKGAKNLALAAGVI